MPWLEADRGNRRHTASAQERTQNVGYCLSLVSIHILPSSSVSCGSCSTSAGSLADCQRALSARCLPLQHRFVFRGRLFPSLRLLLLSVSYSALRTTQDTSTPSSRLGSFMDASRFDAPCSIFVSPLHRCSRLATQATKIQVETGPPHLPYRILPPSLSLFQHRFLTGLGCHVQIRNGRARAYNGRPVPSQSPPNITAIWACPLFVILLSYPVPLKYLARYQRESSSFPPSCIYPPAQAVSGQKNSRLQRQTGLDLSEASTVG